MFTGIVEDIGFIKKSPTINSPLLTIVTSLDGIKAGDSVCVQGICLTAVSVTQTTADSRRGTLREVKFELSPETFSRTIFGRYGFLKNGSRVNLERALEYGGKNGRLGGHFVSGHVDDVGYIRTIRRYRRRAGDSLVIGIKSPSMKYLFLKGSVAVDGVSLTVSGVDERRKIFYVTLVSHTIKHTTFNFMKNNQPVNLEYDLLAKYCAGVVPALPREPSEKDENSVGEKPHNYSLIKEKLKDAGFEI